MNLIASLKERNDGKKEGHILQLIKNALAQPEFCFVEEHLIIIQRIYEKSKKKKKFKLLRKLKEYRADLHTFFLFFEELAGCW